MEIEFANESLALIETNNAGVTELPIAIIRLVRRKIVMLRAAPDDRTLQNWKCLNYERLRGDRDGRPFIWLNEKYRLVYSLDNNTDPKRVTIMSIEDYHK